MSEPETARPWDQVPERFQAVRRLLQAAREWLSGAAGRVTTVRSLRATRGSGVRSCNSGAFPADSAVSGAFISAAVVSEFWCLLLCRDP